MDQPTAVEGLSNASIVLAWKLTDQEMKDRKLDLASWRERRVVRQADNTEAVLGITAQELCQVGAHPDTNSWFVSFRTQLWPQVMRMWELTEELITSAPRPAPPGFIGSTPIEEFTMEPPDGTLLYTKYVVKFDADEPAIVCTSTHTRKML